MTFLEEIIAHKKEEISELSMRLKNAKPHPSKRDFLKALTASKQTPALIAEIKRSSPSGGDISPNADILSIAETYESCNASAISVLTDYRYFGGSLADLQQISRTVHIPVLRKDFILDASQILEARMSEADAVLLMVSILQSPSQLKELLDYTHSLGMNALVEIHNEKEIEIALKAGAKIIGVNARDFTDLSVDIKRLPPLLQKIPKGIVRVAESGMKTRKDIEYVSPYCNAVLIGTGLLSEGEKNISEKIHSLFSHALLS